MGVPPAPEGASGTASNGWSYSDIARSIFLHVVNACGAIKENATFAGGTLLMKALLLVLSCGIAWAQLLPDRLVRDVLSEISSENAFEHTRALAGRVRYPNSASFFEAA